MQDEAVADLMVNALEGQESAFVTSESLKPKATATALSARISLVNEGVYRAIGDHLTWERKVEKLSAALVRLPDLSDYGYLRWHPPGAVGWASNCTRAWYWFMCGRETRRVTPQQRMDIDQNDVSRYWYVLNRLVPDVNGIQLVTDAHLARANDLSDWVITSLGDGRHLLAARDLEPWYVDPDTPTDVVTAARHDFGDMLLTLEDIVEAEADPVQKDDLQRRRIHMIRHPEDWDQLSEFEQYNYGLRADQRGSRTKAARLPGLEYGALTWRSAPHAHRASLEGASPVRVCCAARPAGGRRSSSGTHRSQPCRRSSSRR